MAESPKIKPAFLTQQEAAKQIGVTSQTLARMTKLGQFPPRYAITPGKSGYRTEDIEHWIKTRPQIKG